MRVSAKTDYAVRAMVELGRSGESEASPVKKDALAAAQGIPVTFLGNILSELRRDGLVHGRPGSDGGYWLAQPADRIAVADVIRAVEGPLATVRGESPDLLDESEELKQMWIALRTNVREVLEAVTIADLVSGELPSQIRCDRRPLAAPGDGRDPFARLAAALAAALGLAALAVELAERRIEDDRDPADQRRRA